MMRDILHLYKSGMGFTDTLNNLAEKIKKENNCSEKTNTLSNMSTTNCCVSCLSDITDEITSVSCLQGHSTCVQNGCLSQWIKLNTLESVNISDAINKVDIKR